MKRIGASEVTITPKPRNRRRTMTGQAIAKTAQRGKLKKLKDMPASVRTLTVVKSRSPPI